MTHWFEDFSPGQVFVSQARTVTETDVVTFAGWSWDTNPVHTDAESARSGRFGDRTTDSLRVLAPEGRLVVLGFTGREIPTVEVGRLLLGNTTVVGAASAEFWRTEPGSVRQQWRELEPLLEAGVLAPPIGAVHPLAEAAEAIRELDERRAVGRVLVRVRDR